MKKIIILLSLAIALSVPAIAAKFTPIKKLSNPKLEALSNEIDKAFSEKGFALAMEGNGVSFVTANSFTRKATEKDLSTMKQFNIKYMGAYPDDEMGATADEVKTVSAKALTENLFRTFNLDDFDEATQKPLRAGFSSIQYAFSKLLKSKSSGLKYFYSDHAYEDGSWSVVEILDTKNNEILAIKLGFNGT